ncbi:MAG: helix-turn-helix domain-containing protein [Bauldia sp.]|nr:helix-turn-helix domain-containing protein [Bauldia sp.]
MAKKEKSGARATMNVDEAAEVLGIGRNAAYEAVSRGEIPSIRLGNRILIPRQAIDRMLGLESTTQAA